MKWVRNYELESREIHLWIFVISVIIIKPSETKHRNKLNILSDFVLNKMLKCFE